MQLPETWRCQASYEVKGCHHTLSRSQAQCPRKAIHRILPFIMLCNSCGKGIFGKLSNAVPKQLQFYKQIKVALVL